MKVKHPLNGPAASRPKKQAISALQPSPGVAEAILSDPAALLSREEEVLLRMSFIEGLPISDVAAAIGRDVRTTARLERQAMTRLARLSARTD